MIHTVSVRTGDSNYARAAQKHAGYFASWFDARLCIVEVLDPQDAETLAHAGESPELLMETEADIAVKRTGVMVRRTESHFRGEGTTAGLLAESKETDLLVLGIPADDQTNGSLIGEALVRDEIPLIRKAECSLLIVAEPPRKLGRILVNYHGGMEGKTALRLAGEIAERTAAEIVVVCIEHELPQAEIYCSTAEKYLKGFHEVQVRSIPIRDKPHSEGDILDLAHSEDAGLIIFGEEPSGFWDRFIGNVHAENLACKTHIPLLVAR